MFLRKLAARIILFVTLSNILMAQPLVQYQHCFGGSYQEFCADLINTKDGGYAILADCSSGDGDVVGYHGGGLFDIWVIKLDSNFNMVWNNCYGNTASEGATCMNATMDGGYIIGGLNRVNGGDVTGNHGSDDAWVIKIDSVGNIQWQKSLGSPYADACVYIEQTKDLGYIAACYAGPGGDVSLYYGNYDYWIVKLDSTGTIQWQKTFGGSDYDYAKCVKQTPDGGYIIAGYTSSNDSDVSFNHGSSDIWIIKTDSAGIMQWQKTFGGTGYDDMRSGSIIITTKNEYVFCGTARSNDGDLTNNQGLNDYWLFKIDSVGNIILQKTYGGTDWDIFTTVIPNESNGYVLGGYTNSGNGDVTLNHNPFDVWLVNVDSLGNILWQNTYGGSSTDIMNGCRFVVKNGRGNYVVTATTWSNDGDVNGSHGPSDVWLFELNNATGMDENHGILLRPQAYPNPFKEQINIRLPYFATQATAQLSDPTGRNIANFNKNNLKESELWPIDLYNLQLVPGIYFLKIKTVEREQTIKLIKI